MESEDYEFYKNLSYLIDTKVEDMGYDMFFSTEIQVRPISGLVPRLISNIPGVRGDWSAGPHPWRQKCAGDRREQGRLHQARLPREDDGRHQETTGRVPRGILRHHPAQVNYLLSPLWSRCRPLHPRLIAIFNEQELELLLSGLPDINIDDLKANTEYHKYTVTSLQIVW